MQPHFLICFTSNNFRCLGTIFKWSTFVIFWALGLLEFLNLCYFFFCGLGFLQCPHFAAGFHPIFRWQLSWFFCSAFLRNLSLYCHKSITHLLDLTNGYSYVNLLFRKKRKKDLNDFRPHWSSVQETGFRLFELCYVQCSNMLEAIIELALWGQKGLDMISNNGPTSAVQTKSAISDWNCDSCSLSLSNFVMCEL